MSFRRAIEITAALLVLACTASATPQTSNDSSSIKRTLDMLAKAGNAGEVRALEKLYSEDVVIVPAKGDPIVGRARALDESLRASREFKLTLELSTDATVINSETAYVRGTSHGWKQDRRTGARNEFSQGYTAVLKNYCGNWRVTRLIWN